MPDLTTRGFKVVFVNTYAELKETMIKEGTEGTMAVSHQIANIHKEIQIITYSKVEILELKNT